MNGERYFETICNHFRRDVGGVALRICGASCEQWLNVEAGVALNWPPRPVLDPETAVFPEKRKLDLPFFSRGQTEWTSLIEAKVVYPWSESDIRARLVDLLGQLSRYDTRTDFRQVFGIVYPIWSNYWSENLIRGSALPTRYAAANEFYSTVVRQVDKVFDGVRWQRSEVTDVVPPSRVELASREVEVGLAAIWISQLRTVDDSRVEGTPDAF